MKFAALARESAHIVPLVLPNQAPKKMRSSVSTEKTMTVLSLLIIEPAKVMAHLYRSRFVVPGKVLCRGGRQRGKQGLALAAAGISGMASSRATNSHKRLIWAL